MLQIFLRNRILNVITEQSWCLTVIKTSFVFTALVVLTLYWSRNKIETRRNEFYIKIERL